MITSLRALALAVALAGGSTLRLSAQDPEVLHFWEACYVSGSLNSCTSLTMFADPFGTHPNSFDASLQNPDAGIGGGGFRVTAWGFFFPGPTDIQVFMTQPEDFWSASTPSGWGSGFVPFGFSDEFSESILGNGIQVDPNQWDEALGGPFFSGEGFSGYWKGDQSLSSLRFAWRGVSEDQSFTFDCIQTAPGVSDCVSVAPEPSTWALLLTGLVSLGLVYRRSRRRGAVTI